MTDPKLFAGPRIRRLRLKMSLSQTAMAAGLGISPSYLNLIERNQRPVTAQLLIKLAEVHDIDPREVKGEADGLSIANLREVFCDPLLSEEMPSDEELSELTQAAPNVVSGVQKLYASWSDAQNQLSKLTNYLAADDRRDVSADHMLPRDAAEHFFTQKAWYFEGLERLAEEISSQLGLKSPRSEVLAQIARDELKNQFELRVQYLPSKVMLGNRRRLDRHTGRVFIDSALPPELQNIEIICAWLQLSQLSHIQHQVDATGLAGRDVRSLLAKEFQTYLALAILCPMELLEDLSARDQLQIVELANRQNISCSDAALRLLPALHLQGQKALCVFVSKAAEFELRRASMAFPVSELDRSKIVSIAIDCFSSGSQRTQQVIVANSDARWDVQSHLLHTRRDDGSNLERQICIFALAPAAQG